MASIAEYTNRVKESAVNAAEHLKSPPLQEAGAVSKLFHNFGGGIVRIGENLFGFGKGAVETGGAVGGFAGKAVKRGANGAARAANVPMSMFNSGFGGKVAATVLIVGGTIASAVGIKRWKEGRDARMAAAAEAQMQEAAALQQNIVDKQTQIAAAQAAIGNREAPDNNVAKYTQQQQAAQVVGRSV